MTTLQTERLLLCEWQEGDADLLLKIAQDPLVMRYITGGSLWSHDEAREFVARQMAHSERYGFCCWKLVAKNDGEMIGFCGVQPLAHTDEFEVGWWLASNRWRQGFATEAARAALEYVFKRTDFDKIVAVIMPDNVPSIAVAERLGMSLSSHVMHKGHDVVKYQVTREEFELKLRRPSF